MTAEKINRIALIIGIILWIAMGVFCWIVGDDLTAKILNNSFLILGSLVGVLIGFLISPEEDEKKNFTTYSKYIITFFTGYLASKLNPAIDIIISGISGQEVIGFRVMVFLATLILLTIETFVVRRYPL